MKRIARISAALTLVCALGQQLTAQVASPQASSRAAAKGDTVVVQFLDGRPYVTGTVGGWVDDIGFYVKPADSAAYLIHPPEVLALRDARSGEMLREPAHSRHHLTRTGKALIGAAVAVAAFVILQRMTCAFCGPIG